MSDQALSKAITQATLFLEQIHDDLQALLNEAIGQLDAAGWQSADGNRVTWDLTNKLDVGFWVIPCPHLLFLPKKNLGSMKSRRMISLCCMLRPAEGTDHGYATLEASFARFPTLVHKDDAWADDFSPSAYLACLGQSIPVQLTPDQFRNVFPTAESVSAIILPLCEVTSAEILRTKVVNPLLALGAAP